MEPMLILCNKVNHNEPWICQMDESVYGEKKTTSFKYFYMSENWYSVLARYTSFHSTGVYPGGALDLKSTTCAAQNGGSEKWPLQGLKNDSRKDTLTMNFRSI